MKVERDIMTIEIKVPDIGDFAEVEVIEVLVNEGDQVVADQSVITVESDKASMEIPCPQAGVIKSLKVTEGDKVSEGTLMLILEVAQTQTVKADSISDAPVAQPEPTQANASKPETKTGSVISTVQPPPDVKPHPVPIELHEPTQINLSKPHASPSVRKFARELGVPLQQVKGSGPKDRITKEDVQLFVKQSLLGNTAKDSHAVALQPTENGLNLLPWPKLDFSKFGETQEESLSRIQKMSGPNLHRNWVMIPHVTQFDEADITDLEAFRVSRTVS